MTQKNQGRKPFALSQSLPFPQEGFLALLHLQAHGYKAALRYQIEAIDFLKHRFELDVKLVEDLIDSVDTGDTVDVFADFFRYAWSDYSKESGKLADIGSGFAAEASRQIHAEADAIDRNMAVRTVA
jgi:hypothetical protein